MPTDAARAPASDEMENAGERIRRSAALYFLLLRFAQYARIRSAAAFRCAADHAGRFRRRRAGSCTAAAAAG